MPRAVPSSASGKRAASGGPLKRAGSSLNPESQPGAGTSAPFLLQQEEKRPELPAEAVSGAAGKVRVILVFPGPWGFLGEGVRGGGSERLVRGC